jgi:hypothetical protein
VRGTEDEEKASMENGTFGDREAFFVSATVVDVLKQPHMVRRGKAPVQSVRAIRQLRAADVPRDLLSN